jgi:hypothetical protein
MHKLIAFVDEKDQADLESLNYPSIFCSEPSEFRKVLKYTDEENDMLLIDSLIIFSERFVGRHCDALKRIIRQHSNLVFRIYDVDEYEEDPNACELDWMINVVNNYYTLKDVRNEFEGNAKLVLYRNKYAKYNMESSVDTYLEPRFPRKTHLVSTNWRRQLIV